MNIVDFFPDSASHVGFVSQAQRFSKPFADRIDDWRQECPNGSWLLWVAGNCGVDPKLLVAAACDCARHALPYLPPNESRPAAAILLAEQWTRGEAAAEDCRRAGDGMGEVSREIGERLQSPDLPPVPGVNVMAAMLAVAAAEMPAMAAAWSQDRKWCANFAAQAANRAANAARHAIDDEAMWAQQRLFADLVRARIPAFALLDFE